MPAVTPSAPAAIRASTESSSRVPAFAILALFGLALGWVVLRGLTRTNAGG